jgi:hypothetical protein
MAPPPEAPPPLSQTKDLLEMQYLDDERMKEDRRRRFTEQEAKMRALIRQTTHPHDNEQANDANNSSTSAACPGKRASHPLFPPSSVLYSIRPPLLFLTRVIPQLLLVGTETEETSPATGGRHQHRPRWALTEAAAEVAEEKAEDAEAETLVSFAKELDFERYIGDLEVKTMMEQVVRRIRELETSNRQDESADRAKEERAHAHAHARRLRLTSSPRTNQEDEEDDGYSVVSEDIAAAMAKGVLTERGDDLRAHSGTY